MTEPNHFNVEHLTLLTDLEIEEIRYDAHNAYADEPATWTDVLCLLMTIDELRKRNERLASLAAA
jgi:hypothetical protein